MRDRAVAILVQMQLLFRRHVAIAVDVELLLFADIAVLSKGARSRRRVRAGRNQVAGGGSAVVGCGVGKRTRSASSSENSLCETLPSAFTSRASFLVTWPSAFRSAMGRVTAEAIRAPIAENVRTGRCCA